MELWHGPVAWVFTLFPVHAGSTPIPSLWDSGRHGSQAVGNWSASGQGWLGSAPATDRSSARQWEPREPIAASRSPQPPCRRRKSPALWGSRGLRDPEQPLSIGAWQPSGTLAGLGPSWSVSAGTASGSVFRREGCKPGNMPGPEPRRTPRLTLGLPQGP